MPLFSYNNLTIVICCVSVCSQIRSESLTYKLINWRLIYGEGFATLGLQQSYDWHTSLMISCKTLVSFVYNVYNIVLIYSACETLAKHGVQKPVSFVLETHVCKTNSSWFCFLFKLTLRIDYLTLYFDLAPSFLAATSTSVKSDI